MSYEVVVDERVAEDLASLGTDSELIPRDWRLPTAEVRKAVDAAVRLIASLRDDPHQGEVMDGRRNATILRGCRRLKFDPAEPWPRDARGRPRPRLRLVWINEPSDGAVARVRVLAVAHRFDSRPYSRAASRLGDVRRRPGRRR